jgi:hypothetical protein
MGARRQRHSTLDRELCARVGTATAGAAESNSGRWRRLQRRARSTDRYARSKFGIGQFTYQHYRRFSARPRGRTREYVGRLHVGVRR